MLRLQVVRTAGVPYYVRDLLPGRAEGTGVAGESPGAWTGRGSAVLGVRGTVGSAQFAEVFAGRDPLGERALRSASGPRAVAGVDLLFCAPKSVSLLHLLGPREVADAAGAAHEHAVADAVAHLEREGLGVRRSVGGVTRHLGTTGAVAAAFVHRTSRALDPHVHTHLVVANVVQGVDGVWSAMDTRRLFGHRRPLGAVYDASLRRQLTDRLGAAWERGAGGRWDLAGVDPVMVRLFSRRAASIEEHLLRGPGARTRAGRQRAAFHAERPDKDATPTVAGLRQEWRRRAADHGLDPADLVDVVGRARTVPGRETVDRGDLVEHLGVVAGRRRTLDARDLTVAVAESAPCGLYAHQVAAATAALAGTLGASDARRPAERPGDPAAGPVHRWDAVDVVAALARGGPLVDGVAPTGAPRDLRAPGREREGIGTPGGSGGRAVAPDRGRPSPGHGR